MLKEIPSEEDLLQLLGEEAFIAWKKITAFLQQNYPVEITWDIGRKVGIHECKFRRGAKTLCSLNSRENYFGVVVIFGKYEREQFEQQRASFSEMIRRIYDETHQYHDGKWLMIEVRDEASIPEIQRLIRIKQKPPRKAL